MIHLLEVAKVFFEKGHAPKLVFRPTSVTLPADRRVAILGQRRQGKTVLLQMLVGAEAPDQGEVVTALRLSPVVNSRGALLDSRLTGLENIRFLARLFGVDADRLTLAVDAFSGTGGFLSSPVKGWQAEDRTVVEAAITAVLPFDSYLIDHATELGPTLLGRFFDAAAQRNSGVIFATRNSRFARQFADFGAVIRDQTLYTFNHIDEAIEFYERQEG